jgi:hypothetical protein
MTWTRRTSPVREDVLGNDSMTSASAGIRADRRTQRDDLPRGAPADGCGKPRLEEAGAREPCSPSVASRRVAAAHDRRPHEPSTPERSGHAVRQTRSAQWRNNLPAYTASGSATRRASGGAAGDVDPLAASNGNRDAATRTERARHPECREACARRGPRKRRPPPLLRRRTGMPWRRSRSPNGP